MLVFAAKSCNILSICPMLIYSPLNYREVSGVGISIDAMDGDGVVSGWETRVGGAGVATVVLTLHIAVGSTQRVNILDVHTASTAKIHCELVKLFIVGHPWWVNIDLVVTWSFLVLH